MREETESPEAIVHAQQFGWIPEIACPSEKLLFIVEILNWRVQKLVLHPTK
jgi:hypothetical protein